MLKLQLMVRVISGVVWLHLIYNQCSFIQCISTCCPTQLNSPDRSGPFKSCAGSVGISLYICSWGWICLFGLEFVFRFLIHLPFGHTLSTSISSTLRVLRLESWRTGPTFAQRLGATHDGFCRTTPASIVACTASWPCGGDVARLVSIRSFSSQRPSL